MQVEALCDPSLNGHPVAIQQHDDVICLSYEARALGVPKHCSPNVAKKTWPGLKFVHVPFSYGSKVSYIKYKEASRRVAKTLELCCQSQGIAIENASIDEWFIDLTKPVEDMLKSGCMASGFEVASDLASNFRAKINELVRLETTAGISSSKPLAKMAVRFGKPRGQFVIDDVTINDAMSRCPLQKLPFCCKIIGKKALQLLVGNLASNHRQRVSNQSVLVCKQAATICQQVMCADVLPYSLLELEKILGNRGSAKWIFDAVRGIFPHQMSQISSQPRAPTIQVSMSLKPTKSLNRVRTIVGWLAQEVIDRIKVEKAAHKRVPEQIIMAFVANSGKEFSVSVGVEKLANTPIPDARPLHWSADAQRAGATLPLPDCHTSIALNCEDQNFRFNCSWQQIAQAFDLFVSDPSHMPVHWLGLSAKKFASVPTEGISKFFSSVNSTREMRHETNVSSSHMKKRNFLSEEKELCAEPIGGKVGDESSAIHSDSATRLFFGLSGLPASPQKHANYRASSAALGSASGFRPSKRRLRAPSSRSRSEKLQSAAARSPKRTKSIKASSYHDSELKIGHFFGIAAPD